jgi:esterase/lipase superfamily enzyme
MAIQELKMFLTFFRYYCFKQSYEREYFKWYSPNLNREIEMLVFFAGYPVILFPTSMGNLSEQRYGPYRISKIHQQGLIQIYCPGSIDKEFFIIKIFHPVHRIENRLVRQMICHEIVESKKTTRHQVK